MATAGTFGFELEAAAAVSLTIVNSQGQLLLQPLFPVNLPAGKQEIPLYLAQLTPGTYQLVLRAGNQVVTTQFIKD